MALSSSDIARAVLDVAGVAAALLALAAGAAHSRSAAARAGLRALLRAHGIVPARLVPFVATVLGPTEFAVGAALLAGVVGRGDLQTAAAASASLFAAYTGYLGRLAATRPGSPCGCLGSDAPVGTFAIARAAALALGCGVLATGQADRTPAAGPVELAIGTLLAAMLWLTPTVLSPPRQSLRRTDAA